MAPKKRPRSPTPPPRVAPEGNSAAANRYRRLTIDLIQGLGREGVDAALDTLFEISDLVLNGRHCAQHLVDRILEILEEAHSDSEEES